MQIKQFRNMAKSRMRGKVLRTWRIRTLRYAVVVLLSVFAFYCTNRFGGLNGCVIQFVVFVTAVGLVGALRQGEYAWKYCAGRGGDPSWVHMLFWLRRGRGYRATILYLQLLVRKTTWVMLLSVPGIAILSGTAFRIRYQSPREVILLLQVGGVLSLLVGLICAIRINQKYALAQMLLAKQPDIRPHEAIRQSTQKMNGASNKLVLLKASFIPMALLCAAVFPAIYLLPYYQYSVICMLHTVLKNAQINESYAEAAEPEP